MISVNPDLHWWALETPSSASFSFLITSHHSCKVPVTCPCDSVQMAFPCTLDLNGICVHFQPVTLQPSVSAVCHTHSSVYVYMCVWRVETAVAFGRASWAPSHPAPLPLLTHFTLHFTWSFKGLMFAKRTPLPAMDWNGSSTDGPGFTPSLFSWLGDLLLG